jgi:hypothetical protein
LTPSDQTIFNIVLGSIAGISLLVGGIGIMNIMLATVTERTRTGCVAPWGRSVDIRQFGWRPSRSRSSAAFSAS